MSGRSQAQRVQCMNNLRQLFMASMQYSDKSGTRAHPNSPEGSLASLQILADSDPESLPPQLFVCPESTEMPGALVDGKLRLTEETCSYEMVPWKVRNTAMGILLYDKSPCHAGGRNVVFSDGHVEYLKEADFQERLAQERARRPTVSEETAPENKGAAKKKASIPAKKVVPKKAAKKVVEEPKEAGEGEPKTE
jgi:prepilin-type processing-associated H-X9-DG protein